MAQQIPTIRMAKVISVDDDTDGDRIKVLLIPEDAGKSKDELDYVFPLLPKMFHIKPKVGESVYVLTAFANDGKSQRFYLGPIITQPNHTNFEPHEFQSTTLNRGSAIKPDEAPSTNPNTRGAFPKEHDISIEGRKNSDIQITDDDVRLRAGVKLCDEADTRNVVFNTKNPAYIKVNYNNERQEVSSSKPYNSTVTVVGDKINLLGNNNNFNLTDPDKLVTDSEMQKIIEKAHQLPYGDVLVEFLSLLRKAFLTHTHAFATYTPVPTTDIENVATYNLNKMLTDNVRID